MAGAASGPDGTQAAADAPFRRLADALPVPVRRTDADGRCDYVNLAWTGLTGQDPEAAMGAGWTAALHPDDRLRGAAATAEALATVRPVTVEYRLRRPDGAWRWVAETARPIAGGGLAQSCIDITDAREAIAEREALLAELQHRVKNNAQATTSFLGLQANRASDPAVGAALRAAARRVLLATRVQDRMFRWPAAGLVELGEEVAASAAQALDLAGRPGMRLAVAVEPGLRLPVARATALALIVNELVANAAWHGFPPGRVGGVQVTLRRDGDAAELVVEDDGIGLPAAAAMARNTPEGALGLHLAPLLARQAGASLRVETAAGTRAVLRFTPA